MPADRFVDEWSAVSRRRPWPRQASPPQGFTNLRNQRSESQETVASCHSTVNRENPDPRQWVGNGSRTVDEMAHAWVDVTYLDQDEYDQMVEAREAAQKATDNND